MFVHGVKAVKNNIPLEYLSVGGSKSESGDSSVRLIYVLSLHHWTFSGSSEVRRLCQNICGE